MQFYEPERVPSETRDVFTVSRLAAEVRAVLEGSFPLLWVEGEISNLAAPRSGHLYFTLKDVGAQVRCALFRNRRQLLRHRPLEGDHVLVRARVSLYEPRGDFQLIVEHLEPAGDGALRRAFEELKARLHAEGLFDPARKHPLPVMPRRIGVITSPTGAAVRDVLQVLGRRAPQVPVRVYPALVQGADAADDLRGALAAAARDGTCDLLILTRGGGSLEDLAAFNDERLARAIAALEIPLISAVGHEIDFTIADFVADQRAPTPSAAAELAAPAARELLERLAALSARLARAFGGRLVRDRERLRTLARRQHLVHPARRLRQQVQRIDELDLRLQRAVRQHLRDAGRRLEGFGRRLGTAAPGARLRLAAERIATARQRLAQAARRLLAERRQRLQGPARSLQAVSPLGTLARGYAIARRRDDGRVIRAAVEAPPGTALELLLGHGALLCAVEGARTDRDAD